MIAHTEQSGNVTDLEAHVLGSILVNGGHFARVADVLSAEDFLEPWHARIFGVMAEIAKAGTLPNMVAVQPYVKNDIIAEGVTAGQYLARLCADGGATPALLLDHARHIKRFSDYRRISDECAAGVAIANQFGGGRSPVELAAELVSHLDPIIASARSAGVRRVSIGEAAQSAVAAAIDRMNGKPTRTISTGIADLDARIGGLEPGEFSILAGRPGMGKTSAALEIARNVSFSGKAVLVFSLEMGGEQLAYRVISSMLYDKTPMSAAPVYYVSIARGKMNTREVEAVALAARDLDRVPFSIEQEGGLTMAQIGARVRREKERRAAEGIELGLVVIDHLGLVRASSRYAGNRTYEMGEISAACKMLAKENDVHVMGLSQLNRGVESRSDKRPGLSDLRESGNLEQDADLVIGAFREAYYLRNSVEPDDAAKLLEVEDRMELIVLKQRQGPVGAVTLFTDIAANAIRNLPPSGA